MNFDPKNSLRIYLLYIGFNEIFGLLLKAIDLLQLQYKINVNINCNQLFRRQSKFGQISKQHAIDTFRETRNSIPSVVATPLRVYVYDGGSIEKSKHLVWIHLKCWSSEECGAFHFNRIVEYREYKEKRSKINE